MEEAEAEATEEEAEAESKMNWREDVLLRVMEASGITDRDAFIAFAADYDSDDNGYLKKGELEDAANAWNAREAEGSDDVAEKVCEICDTINPADAQNAVRASLRSTESLLAVNSTSLNRITAPQDCLIRS